MTKEININLHGMDILVKVKFDINKGADRNKFGILDKLELISFESDDLTQSILEEAREEILDYVADRESTY